MKIGFTVALALAACMACPRIHAEAPAASQPSSSSQNSSSQNKSNQSKSGQNKPVAAPQPSATQSQAEGNPFPGNTSSVPILPSGPNASLGGGYAPTYAPPPAFPSKDQDPVLSPDQSPPGSGQQTGWSSSLTGLTDILPPPDNGPHGKGHGAGYGQLPHPSAKQDVSVGNFYLSTGDWKGAMSRFESALVLDPQNSDVYWGLAVCYRHLGKYAEARANYLKVLEYTSDTRQYKKAAKALRDPQIANAKP